MQSTFVRYERRGDRVVPVRVTKQWVHTAVKPMDTRKESRRVDAFQATRVTEIGYRRMPREVAVDENGHPVAWQSYEPRQESRARMLTLYQQVGKVREPVLFPAGAGEDFLPATDTELGAVYGWSLDNGNGWQP